MKRSTKSAKTTSTGPARAKQPAAQASGTKTTSPASKAVGHASPKGASKTSLPPNSTTAELDRALLELLARRVEATRCEMQATATATGSAPPLWQLHETAIARTTDATNKLGLDPVRTIEWIKHIVSLSYAETHVTEPIAYLGPIYSYSYLAASKHFGLAAPLVPVATIAAVFDELIRGQATFGVVPIENSTDGRVVDTLGMFARLPVKICGEVLLPVHHCLLGRCPRAEITEIYSKPQAMSQCRGWLSKHVPDARLIEISSTAAAARLAAEKPGAAAVASREAGIHHGLHIIDENIEDNQNNVTRFAVIGNKECEPTSHDKTSLMFQLPHQPCALADALDAFRSAKLNLTWIESFPLADHPNEYLFFVELEGHIKSKSVSQALNQLGKYALRLEILGSYPKALH